MYGGRNCTNASVRVQCNVHSSAANKRIIDLQWIPEASLKETFLSIAKLSKWGLRRFFCV